jgi:hypothetical protein
MRDALLVGVWRFTVPIPQGIWRRHLHEGGDLGFMSQEDHQVRNYVVRELPRAGKPLSPESIARALDMPLPQVADILAKLERHMTFLYRNPQGEVTWAYPVTVDQTPHRVTFSTGEQVYAA